MQPPPTEEYLDPTICLVCCTILINMDKTAYIHVYLSLLWHAYGGPHAHISDLKRTVRQPSCFNCIKLTVHKCFCKIHSLTKVTNFEICMFMDDTLFWDLRFWRKFQILKYACLWIIYSLRFKVFMKVTNF